MALFNRIAIAVDFSDASRIALRAAFDFAALTKQRELLVVNAVPRVVLPDEAQEKLREELEQRRSRIQSEALRQLEAMCRELSGANAIGVSPLIVEGEPVHAIPKVVDELQVSLLLIGSNARKGIRRWLEGSIAEALLERIEIPTLVLVIGDDGIPPDAELAHLETLLIAVDRDRFAERIIEAGAQFARAFERPPRIVVVHALEPGASDERTARSILEPLLPDGAELRIEAGPAHHVIPAIREETSAQTMVIGTRGGRLAALLGSTALFVVRHADVPVLVVPHGEAG